MDLSGHCVLVIDDNPFGRRLVVEALREWRADVIAACEPLIVQRVERTLDAAIVALPTAGNRCFEVLRELRRRWPRVHVIASTALQSEELAPLLPSPGIDVLPRPLLPERLREVLRSRLSDVTIEG